MTLLLDQSCDGAGTHALVVGVGNYPHLTGGTGALFPGHAGMGQLSSPPQSAKTFSEWLLHCPFRNTAKPLQTLDVLISCQSPVSVKARDGLCVDPEPATFQNIELAVKRWKRRGDANEDNLLLFFFCGHGIARGPVKILLPEDYGSDQDAPLRKAISFDGLWLGMDQCKARQQCFFIDACRVSNDVSVDAYNYEGDPIIYGSSATRRNRPRQAPVFNAAIGGTKAYSRVGKPSFFTSALLDAMEGAGSDDTEGSGAWEVCTDALARALPFLVQNLSSNWNDMNQLVEVDRLSPFTLHSLTGKPVVPVAVNCDPSQANAFARLACKSNGKSKTRKPAGGKPWVLKLNEGQYEFVATFDEPPWMDAKVNCWVRPPYRRIPLKVR